MVIGDGNYQASFMLVSSISPVNNFQRHESMV